MDRDQKRQWRRDYQRQRLDGIRAGTIEPYHGTSEGITARCCCDQCNQFRVRRTKDGRPGVPRRDLTPAERSALRQGVDRAQWAALAARLVADGVTKTAIGAAVGVRGETVHDRLKAAGLAPGVPDRRRKRAPRRKQDQPGGAGKTPARKARRALTEEEAATLRSESDPHRWWVLVWNLIDEGVTQRAIAEALGCHHSWISKRLSRHRKVMLSSGGCGGASPT